MLSVASMEHGGVMLSVASMEHGGVVLSVVSMVESRCFTPLLCVHCTLAMT